MSDDRIPRWRHTGTIKAPLSMPNDDRLTADQLMPEIDQLMIVVLDEADRLEKDAGLSGLNHDLGASIQVTDLTAAIIDPTQNNRMSYEGSTSVIFPLTPPAHHGEAHEEPIGTRCSIAANRLEPGVR